MAIILTLVASVGAIKVSHHGRLSSTQMPTTIRTNSADTIYPGGLNLRGCIQLPVGYLSADRRANPTSGILQNTLLRKLSYATAPRDDLRGHSKCPCHSSPILPAKAYVPHPTHLTHSRHAYQAVKPTVWRSLFQSSWKGFSSEIDMVKDNLARHRRLIETRASLVEFETVQNLRTQSETNFRELKLAEDRRRKTSVFQWLSSPNVQISHERCLEARTWNPKSCHWILADNRFQDWLDPLFCSTPLLWINGKPGAGS